MGGFNPRAVMYSYIHKWLEVNIVSTLKSKGRRD